MNLCSDCPPVGYPTDITRCTPCPRRETKRFSFISDENGESLKPSPNGNWVSYTDHVAALEAVKATKVRELKWNFFDVPHDYGKGVYDANSEVGTYSIYISTNFAGEPFYCPKLSKQFTSLDETKAAAQADYEQRILSALVPSPALEANQQVIETLKAEHRAQMADMSERFREVNVTEALRQMGNDKQVIDTLRAALLAERQADMAEERYDAMIASPDYDDDAVIDDQGQFVLELRTTAKQLRIAALTPPTQDEVK